MAAEAKSGVLIVIDGSLSKEPDRMKRVVSIVEHFIELKIFEDSSDEVSVVASGIAAGDGRSEAIISSLSVCNWAIFDHVSEFGQKIGQQYCDADVTTAIRLGIEHVREEAARRPVRSCPKVWQLMLFSELNCHQFSDMSCLLDDINELAMSIHYVGVDLDQLDLLSARQLDFAQMFNKFLRQVDGCNYVIDSFDGFLSGKLSSKRVGFRPWKNVSLNIRDLVSFPIVGVNCIKPKSRKPFKKYYIPEPDRRLMTRKVYHLIDENDTVVDEGSLIESYPFGASFFRDDGHVLSEFSRNPVGLSGETYRNEKSLEVICFVPLSCFVDINKGSSRHLLMGNGPLDLYADGDADDADGNLQQAFACLVEVLLEHNLAAIGRRVFAKSNRPRLGCLLPSVVSSENDRRPEQILLSWQQVEQQIVAAKRIHRLIWLELPFSQYCNEHMSGNFRSAEKRPVEADCRLVNQLIDSLMQPRLPVLHDPHTQRLLNDFRSRAVHPTDPVRPMDACLDEIFLAADRYQPARQFNDHFQLRNRIDLETDDAVTNNSSTVDNDRYVVGELARTTAGSAKSLSSGYGSVASDDQSTTTATAREPRQIKKTLESVYGKRPRLANESWGPSNGAPEQTDSIDDLLDQL